MRPISKNLLVTLASLIGAGLAAEAAVRLTFPEWAPRTARITEFWQYDAELGWAHVPGAQGRFSGGDFDSYVTINERGHRGPSVPYERNCKSRVVLLGDSFVWGYGVDYEDTFAARLEALDPELEVVNLGVSGYSIDQELLLYESEGYKYDSDLTVLFVASNDFPYHLTTEAYLVYGKPAFQLRSGELELINQPVQPPDLLKRIIVRLGWSSYIVTQLYRVIEQDSADAAPSPSEAAAGTPQPIERPGFPRSRVERLAMALIERFDERVTANDSRFLVVLIENVGAQQIVSGYLNGHGIDTLLLQPHIPVDSADLHLEDRLHWSPGGHEIVARALSEKIAEMELQRHPSVVGCDSG